jgi:hypothetical protein
LSSPIAERAVTETSTPLDARWKRSLNDSLIVSVKTNVPATKATPITTASVVSAVRSLRASSPRSAIRSIRRRPS